MAFPVHSSRGVGMRRYPYERRRRPHDYASVQGRPVGHRQYRSRSPGSRQTFPTGGDVTDSDTSFVGRYGPWALVAGASEGVGAAYARAMAERGLNVILLARRQAALDDLASSIRAAIGVQTRTVAVDLTEPDAMTRIVDATSGLDVGMLMYCAGADPDYQPFLENRMEAALAMV